jgi:hypothetical protein
MGYVDRRLTTGESVLYHARLHWVIFVAPALIALAGVAAIALGGGARFGGALQLIGFGLLLLAGAMALVRWLVRTSSEFVVTNRRVLIKVGVLGRHSLELLLTKVEGIGVDQDLWGRLLDYGTVVVSGTGGTREAFTKIADPLRFRTEVQSRVPA